MLETESHGDVESGFYAAFMQLARLGEYTFATKHLCELVQYFAKDNKATETKAIVYDLDTFEAGNTRYHQQLFQLFLKDIEESDLTQQLQKLEIENPLKLGKDAHSNGKIIPVVVAREEDSISIGEYKIASLHFGRMAYYLAHGGFFGWPGTRPEFAEETMTALRNSDRKMYQLIRLELEEIIKSDN